MGWNLSLHLYILYVRYTMYVQYTEGTFIPAFWLKVRSQVWIFLPIIFCQCSKKFWALDHFRFWIRDAQSASEDQARSTRERRDNAGCCWSAVGNEWKHQVTLDHIKESHVILRLFPEAISKKKKKKKKKRVFFFKLMENSSFSEKEKTSSHKENLIMRLCFQSGASHL
jgi:hypothetical protein